MEKYYGSLDGRYLRLRFYAPPNFQRWSPEQSFRFAPLKLLNPMNWWRVAKYKSNWRIEWWRHTDTNWRCWCPVGNAAGGAIVICGFGLQWWYHNYTGPSPCWCDIAMDEMQDEEDREYSDHDQMREELAARVEARV